MRHIKQSHHMGKVPAEIVLTSDEEKIGCAAVLRGAKLAAACKAKQVQITTMKKNHQRTLTLLHKGQHTEGRAVCLLLGFALVAAGRSLCACALRLVRCTNTQG